MPENDYYAILGVSRTATAEEIKSAYRALVRKHHPDVDKSDGAEERFKKINQAYEVLSDPQKRHTYDQFGAAAFEGNAAGGNAGYGQGPFGGFGGFGNGGFSYTWSSSQGFDDLDPFDILNSFFGGSRGGRKRTPTYEIVLSFEEAVKGVEKEVRLESGESKKIKIPAGVDDGVRVRFDTFQLLVRVQPSKIFQRDGYDLIVEQEVPLTMAILGGEIAVPTMEGPIKLRIQPGLQPGATVRLRGYGVPSPRGGGKGDLYVKYKIHIPTNLSSKAKKIVEELHREIKS
jgi:DnaJ-class molecular chaperone